MRVLISGGEGFLGRACAARAREAGYEVVTLDLSPAADFACDLGDSGAVIAAIQRARPQAIVHFGAVLTDAADRDPVLAVRSNALGTAALFTAAEAVRTERVIYAGSIAAVGAVEGGGDDVALRPGSIYGATKAFGEHLAHAMSARANAPSYLTLRFGWVYGPGRVRGWRPVQQVIERILGGERHVRYPDYSSPIDWTWIDDAAEVVTRALATRLPRYAAHNALGDRRTVREAMAHLARHFPDLDAQPESAITPPAAWTLVNSGLAGLLGYEPQTRLEVGLDRMIARAAMPQSVPS